MEVRCSGEGCEVLAAMPIVGGGFLCVGRMSKPTDHGLPKVNDLALCFQQGGKRDMWHFNGADIRLIRGLLAKAMRADEGGQDAIHNAGPAEDTRPNR